MGEVLGTQAIERVVVIPDDHPCLPGHFPKRPIVPAVIILDEVRATVTDAHPQQAMVAIDHCKFQDFVLPNRPFKIALTASNGSVIDFVCKSADDDRLLANGRIRLEPRGSVA